MMPLRFYLASVPIFAGAIVQAAAPPTSQPIGSLQARARMGTINHPGIKESSGIVASRQFTDVFWTHNDSGHPAELFAINQKGELLAEYKVAGGNVDWEDIAIDDAGWIYIADIGNNSRTRREIQILVVEEPDPASPAPAELLRPERVFRLRYPESGAFESEAFFVHDGRGYLVSKQFDGGLARLYAFDLAGEEVVRTLEAAGELPLRAPVTAADISPDGQWLAVMTVAGPSLFEIDSDLSTIGDGATHSRFSIDALAEAITFVPDGLLVTNEGGQVLVFRWEVSNPEPEEEQGDD